MKIFRERMNDDGESGDSIFTPGHVFNPEFSNDLNPELDSLSEQETSLNFNFNGSNEHGTECKYCNIRYEDFYAAVNHSCMPFKCVGCDTAFLYDYQLKMHQCSKKNSDRTDTVTPEDNLCICSGCGSTFADSKLLSNHKCAKKKTKNCLICGRILSSKCLGISCGGCKNKAKNNKYSLRHKNPLSASSTSLSELSSNEATNSSSERQNAFNACNKLKMFCDLRNGHESSESSTSSALQLSKKRRRMNGSGKMSKRKSKQNVLGENSESEVDSHKTHSLFPKSKERANTTTNTTTKNNSTSKEKDEECDILSSNAAVCNDISKPSKIISNAKDKFVETRYSLRCERVNKVAPSLSISETSQSYVIENTSRNNSSASDELEKAAETDSNAVSTSDNQDIIDHSVSNLPKRKKRDLASRIPEDEYLENNCDDNENARLSDTSVNNESRNKYRNAESKRNKVLKCSGRNNVKRLEVKLPNALSSSDCADSVESTDNSISDSAHLSTGDTNVDVQNADSDVQESRIPPVNQISESRENFLDSDKILVSTEENSTSKSKNDVFSNKSSNKDEISVTRKNSNHSNNKCATTTSSQKSDKSNTNILLSTLQTKEKVIAKKAIPNDIARHRRKNFPKEQNLISEALVTDSPQPSTSRIQKQVSCIKRKKSTLPSGRSFGVHSIQKVTFACEPSEASHPAGKSTSSSTSPRSTIFNDNIHGRGKNVPVLNSSRNFETHTSSIMSHQVPSSNRKSFDLQGCPNLSEIVPLDVLFKALPNYGGVVSKTLTDGCIGYKCVKCNHLFRQIKKATDHSHICQIFKLIKKTSVSIREVEFVCTSCYQHWPSLDELYDHKKYCPVLLTKSNVQISDFIHSYENTSKNYVCPKCSYSCLSSYKFSQHPCKKRLDSFKMCFVKVEKLKEDELGFEESLSRCQCPICQEEFLDPAELENHSKIHVNAGLNAAKSQIDSGKAYAKKEIKKVISNNKNCSSVDDMMKRILEPVSEILAHMDSNNAFPDFNLDIPLPYEQQKLFNEAVKQVLSEEVENMDTVNETSKAQEISGLENMFASKDSNSGGHTSSADNEDNIMKDFICKCIKEPLDPKTENKPCLKCLNVYMLSKLNESGKDFTLSAPVTVPTFDPSNPGSFMNLASGLFRNLAPDPSNPGSSINLVSDLFRSLASCSSSFSAVSSLSDFFTTEASASGCSTASCSSEAAVASSSVSLSPSETQAASFLSPSPVIQDSEESRILASFTSKGDSNVTNVVPEENSVSTSNTSDSSTNVTSVVPEGNRILTPNLASNTGENNTNVTNVTETSIPCQITPETCAPSNFTFANADECSSSTQSDCSIVYCYLPPTSAFSQDQKPKIEIKPEETFGTEFENMLPIVKVIQDESKNNKIILYPKIEMDCKNSVKKDLYCKKLSETCDNLFIEADLLQTLKPESQLCEKGEAYLEHNDSQSTSRSGRKIIYWLFEKLMNQFLKEENDFKVSFVMFPPFYVTVSIDWYLDPHIVYSVYALKDSMQFACGTCIEELSVSSLLEHVIEKHKETVINILIA